MLQQLNAFNPNWWSQAKDESSTPFVGPCGLAQFTVPHLEKSASNLALPGILPKGVRDPRFRAPVGINQYT